MADHSLMKLGKLAPVRDPRVKAMARYSAALPVPEPVDWLKGKTDFGMMLNNILGCCTISSKGHGLQIATMNVRGEFTAPDALIENYYEIWDGYRPGDASTDRGGVISDVLAKAKAQNFCGRHLAGYCTVNPLHDLEVDQVIALFGVLDVGVALPLSAQSQDVWDIPDGQPLTGDWEPNSWGGHDISIHAFDADGDLTAITWGAPKKITRRWFKTYCDEAYGLLWAAWVANSGQSASGFAYRELLDDLNRL